MLSVGIPASSHMSGIDAPRYNEGVLEEIFLLLPRSTLANAVRDCRDWLPTTLAATYLFLTQRSLPPPLLSCKNYGLWLHFRRRLSTMKFGTGGVRRRECSKISKESTQRTKCNAEMLAHPHTTEVLSIISCCFHSSVLYLHHVPKDQQEI